MSIRSVLFDLDGTLADTAPDLALALNTLLVEEGREPLAFEVIRAEASNGGRALIKLGFGLNTDDPQFESLRRRFLAFYQDRLCEHTVLFPGMKELLGALADKNLSWGIVTNKPAFLTDNLVMQLGVDRLAACVVSGDTTTNIKPHPGPLLHACAQMGSVPAQCLFVGDAERDIEAGRRAGMKTLVASFGYLRDSDDPLAWGPDGIVDRPSEILDWLAAHD